MNIIFFGNTKYSTIGADIIHRSLGITAVVTIPDYLDKKRGIIKGPVKSLAEQYNLPVIQTDKLTQPIIEQIKTFKPDFFVVEDYGLILPEQLLQIPKHAPLNIHHSLLPKYRGPSPAPSAILAGERKSGVTVIHMTNKVDAGDIYAQEKYTMQPEETTDSLLTELNKLGGNLAVQVIHNLKDNKIKKVPQNEDQATYTNFLEKSDGFINLNNPPAPEILDRMIRAYYPWPGVWFITVLSNKETRIKLLPEKRVHVEGRKPMTIKDFFNGYPNLDPQLKKLLT